MRVYAWASLVSQIALVVTGGLVRLTGSGLGCPTWPECEDGSITNVPALGIHGVIEFTNRMLTFALLVIAVLTFITVFSFAKNQRKGLFWTSLVLGLGIFVQAVIGGISVLTGLNSYIVGTHFLVSAALITVATILLWFSYGRKLTPLRSGIKTLTGALYPVGILTIIIGVLVTGSGPHAGDAKTPRNGINPDLITHLHSYPAYLTLGLVLVQILLLVRTNSKLTSSLWLLVALLVQATIGIWQTRSGLPIELVAVHLLGASVLVSLFSWQVLSRGVWFSSK
jgi:cytochrome c oxidase assembly protein subunit 15